MWSEVLNFNPLYESILVSTPEGKALQHNLAKSTRIKRAQKGLATLRFVRSRGHDDQNPTSAGGLRHEARHETLPGARRPTTARSAALAFHLRHIAADGRGHRSAAVIGRPDRGRCTGGLFQGVFEESSPAASNRTT